MVNTREEVISTIRANKAELQRLAVVRISVFGSAARDELQASSDVDLLVEFAPGKLTLRNFMGAKFLLEEVFGRKVDLATADSVRRPRLQRAIEKDIIYAA